MYYPTLVIVVVVVVVVVVLVVVVALTRTNITGVIQHVSWLCCCGISINHRRLSVSVLPGYATTSSLHGQITTINLSNDLAKSAYGLQLAAD